ncbi:Gfo/Idh/MocA family protein [Enterobacillus tribolii]|uniref:Virulence factor n=1 Tax=Enterobacillus tribolii TaxID=1487935 RepID=A0A370R4P2_9GAMM|nr:Gfo/Idh/MocA family oxidoreductase [Enterobacillus tribolii]MBW7983337.1 Gfo/Idh/MocA family oxidoreductase [Enterobacillus tribolii]RDK97394.1 virulence factor [Enterobacillus tribolii]
MTQPRIGIVGLGSIAQKAYLPVLSHAGRWQLRGAFSPGQQKAAAVCAAYRITPFASLMALADECDALFVHSSTASHFEVVSALLRAGKHVYVDKPLAGTLAQAEQLVELAARRGLHLMVGFNRRFAPVYQQIKQQMSGPASIRMDKHRCDGIGPHDARFTLLDDYLHVIDTALWMSGETLELQSGGLRVNDAGQLIYAGHQFRAGACQVATSMHRAAGSQRETLQVVMQGAIYDAADLRRLQVERQGVLSESPAPGWQTTLEQRGFTGAIGHFIDCLEQNRAPLTSGDQALAAQRLVESLLP